MFHRCLMGQGGRHILAKVGSQGHGATFAEDAGLGFVARELPAIDAGVVPTQFVSGILPPRVEGGVYVVEVYEERCGHAMVIARFAMTEAVYQSSVAKALALVATALLLPSMNS